MPSTSDIDMMDNTHDSSAGSLTVDLSSPAGALRSLAISPTLPAGGPESAADGLLFDDAASIRITQARFTKLKNLGFNVTGTVEYDSTNGAVTGFTFPEAHRRFALRREPSIKSLARIVYFQTERMECLLERVGELADRLDQCVVVDGKKGNGKEREDGALTLAGERPANKDGPIIAPQ
ncbi:MAG TPA: hypothetical protein VFQ61_33445 [Polyangiaceae bacterium]|nr:hypothetical protein [Polyangiaceae bacterium]